jgi:hypothetical protein
MNFKLKILILSAVSLLLVGCVDREYADETLKRGCIAGIKAMLPEDKEFRDVIKVIYEPSPVGPDFRHVKITAIEMDGWLETEAEYQCIFQESFGFLKKTHTASIYQLRYGEGLMIGKSGKDIIGSPEDFMKLTDAIRDALYE